MDSLVAQYSRPSFQDEGYDADEQYEVSQSVPPLSLKFALPPIPNVSFIQQAGAALALLRCGSMI